MSFPATPVGCRTHTQPRRRDSPATIIEAYWKPAYKHLRTKWSLSLDDAADLTQELAYVIMRFVLLISAAV
ncbi:MAG: hypothetical protein WC815_20615 [Vicinamibacterales bacterium]|jgi:hypothetical protein